ncbi:ImmA/IrrE family metallo-endopeptidase [Amylibacter sp. IMCC11727]|uniref:ImmA/IrrE family metallo-endopeptidase n=1 Tax=Amylibacter sp. IMCC11727 TaxID=3039851 RepID=UPI00244DD5ED|nr:ImmA/IrrE family metallo-endopeptidase [Amylibacter sp. IMCC11727]WGI23369.1 ImmA/IrrE family metallo-endopeptidase [Amylibacter sp. IMCC11727]
MNTTEKCNRLEDEFFAYLIGQKTAGLLVFDFYPSDKCQIFKKKKYYCSERQGDIEFDVVIEIRREVSSKPHLTVVFECKNQSANIQERDVTDFSDKLHRVFGNGVKGVLVVSGKLQSGARNIVDKRKIGIIKFEEQGFEVVADRRGRTFAEGSILEQQIFETGNEDKALKFAAYVNGKCVSSPAKLLLELDPSYSPETESKLAKSVPSISNHDITSRAKTLLNKIGYSAGPVNLSDACEYLGVNLVYTARTVVDPRGNKVLGSANFDRNEIHINDSETEFRERFTLGHEIGHFYLGHGEFLRSEATIQKDLFVQFSQKATNLQRLETQANKFSSALLLPEDEFALQLAVRRNQLGIQDRGHGYLFVDDQPCNYSPYNQLLTDISEYFKISKQVIEIRLKSHGLLNDQRYNAQRLASIISA